MNTILIVDDESFLLDMMKKGLKAYKDRFDVMVTQRAHDAQDIFSRNEVDLVVLDLRMPGMDGFELMEWIKIHYPKTVVIIHSAFITDHIERSLTESGAFMVLRKPVSLGKLTKAIMDGLESGKEDKKALGINAKGFLFLLVEEKKDAFLEVRNTDGEKGYLFFKEGVLFDAVVGKISGEAGVRKILFWTLVEIRFRGLPKGEVKKRITKPLETLVSQIE